ncbi:senescence-specific cysteine protease SAG39 [Nicotiana tabacum]|uniref:Senescence-specific cysteine protease SAG39 n=1 Tax=Nicotiana tabacum TaxID=4097 RepID=A0A1S3XDA6_TOBAC
MAMKINLISVLILFFVVGMYKSHATARNLQPAELSVSERHELWMARHGRVYKDEVEKGKRLMIFKENMQFIESVNRAGNLSYKLGINEFADITSEEFFARYTGLNMPSHLPSSPISSTEFKINDLTDDMPSNLDWREKGAVTEVKQQGHCGCCWAFSAVGALEGAYQIATGQKVELSEQELLDCTTNNNGCNGGFMTNAFEFIIQNGGISTESDYPYETQQDTCRSQELTPAVKISSYQVVPESETALLQAVTQQPVSIGISASQEFQFYQGGTYQGSCADRINHAVTAIGYGTDEQGQNYWLLKNSWGTSWGENGFMRIIRGTGGHCDITKLSSYPVI